MRLAFMGSPDFSVPALAALVEAGHEVVCVYTQPPRPAGRGHKERPCPVHAYAAEQGFEVRTPVSLKDAAEQRALAELSPDIAVVAAYGLILPQAVLDAPKYGCVNIHASLLPRWRGAAPIQCAIEAGDDETGISIMAMEAGLDTGPVYAMRRLPITETTTAEALHDALAAVGAGMIVDALPGIAAGTLKPTPQPADGVTYAAKLGPGDGRLDWTQPAAALARKVRAFNPWPGVWCMDGTERLKVLAADATSGNGAPGEVIGLPLVVACSEGALNITRAQRAGKAAMDAGELVRGHPLHRGARLD
ncbi:MAG: methionyl-tRNA formyltransferase [Rhodospirillaceae bacterium]